MRIVIVQGAFLPVPALRGGAVEKIWLALGREFARRGHEVLHVSRHCDDLPVEEMIDGVRHERVRGHDATRSRLLLKWRDFLYTRRVAARLPKVDIVVTNTFWAPLLFRPAMHGKLWVHVQRYPQGQMRFYHRAACLQTVSSVIARAMIKQAPRLADRVRVIANPVPSISAPAREVKKDPNLVLFVGRLHEEKGILLLIEAMILLRRQRPEARLRLVGPWQEQYGGGGPEFNHTMRTLALPLGRAIEFIGPVFDEAVLSAHYEEAAVFVYPSLAAKGEASPVAPLEALAHGLPVVISDLDCFDDYLPAGGACGHRFNHEVTSAASRLAGVIDGILGRPEAWPAMAVAARARADEYSVERIATQYLDGFESVLEPIQHPTSNIQRPTSK